MLPLFACNITSMDGGTCNLSKIQFIPFFLNIVTLSHPCDRDIPFFLNIVTLSHPCDRDIPFFLNIVTLSHPCDRDIPFFLNIKTSKIYSLCSFLIYSNSSEAIINANDVTLLYRATTSDLCGL
jgi:hypothetical protein